MPQVVNEKRKAGEPKPQIRFCERKVIIKNKRGRGSVVLMEWFHP